MPARRSLPGRARRVWGVAWLPLLLGGLAVALEPLIDGFLLGLVLLVVALATTWARDVLRETRRPEPREPQDS